MTPSAAPPPLTRWHWRIPALALGAGTLAVWLGDLDRRAAALFYVPGDPTGWPIGYAAPWHVLYRWGVVPAILLGAAGLLAYARGCLPMRDRQPLSGGQGARRTWRRAGLLLVLSLALGPLLLVNGVLHQTWGRPRPRQVMEFGGGKPFLPVLVPTWDATAQSFPTGHAASGFSVMALYFVWRGRRPGWAWGALGGGLALGGITAVARMTQGGHWLSDGLWSAGVVYFSAWAVARALDGRSAAPAGTSAALSPPRADPPRPLRAVLAIGGAVALCAGYLAILPLLERHDWTLPLPAGVTDLMLDLSAPPAQVHTRTAPAPQFAITVTWSGRSGPVARLEDRWEPQPAPPGTLAGRYTLTVTGYRRRQNLEVWVTAPPQVRVTVRRAEDSAQ